MIGQWLQAGVEAIEPEKITATALTDSGLSEPTVIAVGKAAPAMCRGAQNALGPLTGICVTTTPQPVPDGVELIIGDHPVPGPYSLRAGRRVLEIARSADSYCLALISGGGSALCELPRPGIDMDFLAGVNRALLDGGASIEETNKVRSRLSAIKGGGIARAIPGELETLIISDVAGAEPWVVASGPTIPIETPAGEARAIMERHGITVSPTVWEAMSRPIPKVDQKGNVTVLADGQTAARAVIEAASRSGTNARMLDRWMVGPVSTCLESFLAEAVSGVTVAAGEPGVEVTGDGVGGRNSHAALLAARMIEGTDLVFAAFATDGVDGRSSAAGAVVDGRTTSRGGDPSDALANSDSATYLARTGDLIETGPTGTNVSDLWLLWRP